MSKFKRLLPAPPPTENAWLSNQLIKDQNDLNIQIASGNHKTDSITVGESRSQPQSPVKLNYPSKKISASAPSNYSQDSDSNEETILISVGKNLKIKKPKFPKSKDKTKKPVNKNNYTLSSKIVSNDPFENFALPTPLSPLEYFSSVSSPSNMFLYPPPIQFGPPQFFSVPHPEVNDFDLFQTQDITTPRSHRKNQIKRQLQYYFSIENLCKDTYLRSLFDADDGGIELKELVKFNKLKKLTNEGNNFQLLVQVISEIPNLQLIRNDTTVRVDNWRRWVLK